MQHLIMGLGGCCTEMAAVKNRRAGCLILVSNVQDNGQSWDGCSLTRQISSPLL